MAIIRFSGFTVVRPTSASGRRGAAVIFAMLVVFITAAVAYSLLETGELEIRRALMITRRAVAVELSRQKITDAINALMSAQYEEKIPIGGNGYLEGLSRKLSSDGVTIAVYDEQGKFNLNNLVVNDAPSAVDIKIFKKLLRSLSLPEHLADTITDWIDPDMIPRNPGGAEDEYYLGLQPPALPGNRILLEPWEASLAKGFGEQEMARLLPYICALPGSVRLNINSATAQALSSHIEGLSVELANDIVMKRNIHPFSGIADFRSKLPQGASGVREEGLTDTSEYFRITAEVSKDNAWAKMEALVRANSEYFSYNVIWRRTI
ncbi:MAG: type II secretion system minor pseudopilin GspK [Nitrospinota bacterium]|nr:type II secretion system minor pseudopilin GspK [Nitrospinota bacterium]